VLWSSLDDAALVAIAKQAAAGLDPVRLAIWQRLIASATTPAVHVG
jgi:hypothetical protein